MASCQSHGTHCTLAHTSNTCIFDPAFVFVSMSIWVYEYMQMHLWHDTWSIVSVSLTFIFLWWFQLQRKPTCIIVFCFLLFRINGWSAHHIYLARTESILLTLLPHLWHCKNVYGCTAYDNRCEMIFLIFFHFMIYLFVVRCFTNQMDFFSLFLFFVFAFWCSFFPFFPFFDELARIQSNKRLGPSWHRCLLIFPFVLPNKQRPTSGENTLIYYCY